MKKNTGGGGLKIARKFTQKGIDPLSQINYELRTSRITNPDGSIVFEMKDVEVPAEWSQVATDILAQKYFRKKGVPDSKGGRNGSEWSAKQVMSRLAGTWRWWGEKYNYFASAEDACAFEDELKYMLINQMGAPNSPQWFNTGLAWAYGITGEAQGHYYVDPDTKEMTRAQDAYTHCQPHACFIQSIKDDLVNEGGIFDLMTREARLFKYGSGTGSNFSAIRGKNETLSGGGKSSGLMSFLATIDRAAGAIKSGGTTRRAAKMVCLDIDHPEVEDFINWKAVEEQKVAALHAGSYICYGFLKKILISAHEKGIDPKINRELKRLIKQASDAFVPLNYIKRVLMLAQQGVRPEDFDFRTYDTDFRSEAYLTVSGQNSNNSVRLTNEFIKAVQENKEWNLINRTDKKIAKTIPAKKLWDKIAYAAWACADPGVQFDTTFNEWHTCPEDGRINATNPCSEYAFLDDTACNLASINLIKLYDPEKQTIDVEPLKHASRLWTIVLEISVLMAQFPSKEIARKSYDFRTLGLGYANLGTVLMQMGIPYASEEAYAICSAITAILCGESYAASAELAKALNPFSAYERNKNHMLRVIRNHRRAAYNAPKKEYEKLTTTPHGINNKYCPQYLLETGRECWDRALSLGEKYGYRNAQVSVIAPTGCLVGNTLISTEKGLVRLQTLGNPNGEKWQETDFCVLTDEGPRAATRFFINGAASTRKIRTISGYEIHGTLQHRIKVVDKKTGALMWKYFTDIESGDVLPLSLNQIFGSPQKITLPSFGELHWNVNHGITAPQLMTQELAELIGYFMGDGSLHAKGLRFCVSYEDRDVVSRLQTLSRNIFNIEAAVSEKKGYMEIAIHSVPLVLWWEACGFSKKLPHSNHTGKGYTPYIPDAVLYSNDPEIYSAFLRGLFEADGTIIQGNPSWTSSSREFSQEIKTLLLALGFPTTSKIDISGWEQAPIYALRLKNKSYNPLFQEKIGFIGQRKNNLVDLTATDLPQSNRKDYIYLETELVGALLSKTIPQKSAMQLSLKRKGAISRKTALAISQKIAYPELQKALSFFYDTVSVNEDGGEQFTYDLSVPSNTTYLANGFISHNTIGLVMDCDTTGIEPDFALVKFKKLVGGGYFKIVNQSLPVSLKALGYNQSQIEDIEKYVKGRATLAGCPHINEKALRERGFTEKELLAIEMQLSSIFDIRFAFNRFVLGEDFCRTVLGITDEMLANPQLDILQLLDFTPEQIAEANEYICGTMTIEGAPHLKEIHYPIFDCANRCGKRGVRFIPWEAHLRMMGAAQPFISGAISKTINMPEESTIADAEKAYFMSWEYMLKAVALYRDSSKLSQPLNTAALDQTYSSLFNFEEEYIDETIASERIQKAIRTEVAARPVRHKLPAERHSITHKFVVANHEGYITIGLYDSGSPGEIFIKMSKEGSTLSGIMDAFALTISLCLQYGVPLEVLVAKFCHSRFEPSGMTGNKNIPLVKSIVDYIGRYLALKFLPKEVAKKYHNEELIERAYSEANPAHLQKLPAELPAIVSAPATHSKEQMAKAQTNLALSLNNEDAPICGTCGIVMVRNGACYKCLECGETSGCS